MIRGEAPAGLTFVFANLRLTNVLFKSRASASANDPSSLNSTSNKSTMTNPILTLRAFASYCTPLSPNLFIPRLRTFRYGFVERDWQNFLRSFPIILVLLRESTLICLEVAKMVARVSAPPLPRKLWSKVRILMLVGRGASFTRADLMSN